MPIKISIPGGNGRMGKSLIKEILNDKALEIASSSCLPDEVENGYDLGILAGHNKIDKYLTDNKMSIFKNTDVIIDFTVPQASIFHVHNAQFALKYLLMENFNQGQQQIDALLSRNRKF